MFARIERRTSLVVPPRPGTLDLHSIFPPVPLGKKEDFTRTEGEKGRSFECITHENREPSQRTPSLKLLNLYKICAPRSPNAFASFPMHHPYEQMPLLISHLNHGLLLACWDFQQRKQSHRTLPLSGNILLKLLNTSCIGKSLVPTLSFSLLSRSSSRTALSANILSAARPTVSWYCSNLCTPSANSSTLNSRLDCMVRSRSEVWLRRSRADDDDIVASISACSGSRSEASIWLGIRSKESSGKSGGREGGGFARAFHWSLSSFNLITS